MRQMTTRHGGLFASGKAISNGSTFVKFNKTSRTNRCVRCLDGEYINVSRTICSNRQEIV